MREIKFRAWDKLKKSVHEVAGINFVEGIVLLWKQTGTARQTYAVEVDSIELMQYTGLHDKNGKEIYEGDIITYIQELCEYEKREVSPARDFVLGNYVVAWHEESAEWGLIYDWSNKQRISGGLGFWRKRVRSGKQENVMEVIGNIYENKELLS